MTRQQTGNRGENIAQTYLTSLGWQILHCNWRCAQGEIDVAAMDGDELVIVEVRTRRGKAALQRALESVDVPKQSRLMELAEMYRGENLANPAQPLRIDVVGVALQIDGTAYIEHVRDALQW